MSEPRKNIHFMGIGGIGMSALALLLHDRGHQVSGCDSTDSKLIHDLQKQGIHIDMGHSPDHLKGQDMLVYTSAVPATHPERVAAQELGIEQVRRADMLGTIAQGFTHVLAIAGTHGKTTTTGMLGVALEAAGVDPTVFVGGILPEFGSNLRRGGADYLAVEADEFDRSFLTLHPTAAVITSLEPDHLDIYSGLDDLQDTFKQFISQVTPGGPLILCNQSSVLREMGRSLDRQVHFYGTEEDADYQINELSVAGAKSSFKIIFEGSELIELTLAVPGMHNVLNATAAMVLVHSLGLDLEKAAQGLAGFSGVERRFQERGQRQGVRFVDDYAHHPTEVSATLEAAHAHWPESRVIAIFQPHLFSRTRDFAREFALALQLADLAILAPIYPAREEPIEGITSSLIRDIAESEGWQVPALAADRDDIPAMLATLLQPGDIVITMGAGDIWMINDRILDLESA